MIYVMSDIHGNMSRYESVMGKINLQPEDTLYVLGDVIDRYPDGISILQQLMRMPNVQMLLGNHEYMMLNALDTRTGMNPGFEAILQLDSRGLWYKNGGKVTHDHVNQLGEKERLEIFDYLRDLPLNLDIEVGGQRFKLVHGAPVEKYLDDHYRYESATEFAVWRRWRPGDPDLDDTTVIFGHTPTLDFQDDVPLRIWYSRNRRKIGIDCGSGYPPVENEGKIIAAGRLACLRLDDMAEFYSEDDLGGGETNEGETDTTESEAL